MKLDWKTCFKVGATVFILFLGIHYWPAVTKLAGLLLGAAMPLLIGCVIAYIINILMSFYERHYFPKTKKSALSKSRRPVCMVAAFVTLIAVVVLLINIVVPEFISCIQLLIVKLPDTINKLSSNFENINIIPQNLAEALGEVDLKSEIEKIISVLTTGVGNVMYTAINVISSVFSGVVTAVLSVIFAIYLLSGKEKLGNQFERVMKCYMKDKYYTKIKYILSIVNDCFHKYLVGQCTEAVILGTLCTVGMLILGLPYASMIGTLIGFTALIPVAGAYIGAGVGAFMIMTVSPVQAVIFLIYIVVLQQLEGNIIYPRVVGSSMGLPGIWVLVAVTVGGGVMGIPGMLLSVPLFATVYRLIREDVNKRKENI